jgi:hypothetical protein
LEIGIPSSILAEHQRRSDMKSTFCIYLMVLSISFTACSSESPNLATNRGLHGLVVQQSGTNAVIFLGHQIDLQKELADVLAGTEVQEHWYRIELPKADLPASDSEGTYDLTKSLPVTIYYHTLSNIFGNTPTWGSLIFKAGMSGLKSGNVTITGGDLVKQVQSVASDGTFYGIAFAITFRGSLLIDGKTVGNSSWDVGVGAIADE